VHFVVCILWFVVCGLWFVVCGLWFVVCGLWFVVCGLWFKIKKKTLTYILFHLNKKIKTHRNIEHIGVVLSSFLFSL